MSQVKENESDDVAFEVARIIGKKGLAPKVISGSALFGNTSEVIICLIITA